MDLLLDLGRYFNIEMMKIFLIAISLKIYSSVIETKIVGFFEIYEAKDVTPNNFFQMIYELTAYDNSETVTTVNQLIRPGLFDNMKLDPRVLFDEEMGFGNKEVQYDFIYHNIIAQYSKEN